jgi:hypothetical protein
MTVRKHFLKFWQNGKRRGDPAEEGKRRFELDLVP